MRSGFMRHKWSRADVAGAILVAGLPPAVVLGVGFVLTYVGSQFS
jgi:hypothetical protein